MNHDAGLPNDCGLIAAAAWQFLSDRGVRAKLLSIRTGKMEGHLVCIFEASGRLRGYDVSGTLVFNTAATWETSPTVLGKAWAKGLGWKEGPVKSARWR